MWLQTSRFLFSKLIGLYTHVGENLQRTQSGTRDSDRTSCKGNCSLKGFRPNTRSEAATCRENTLSYHLSGPPDAEVKRSLEVQVLECEMRLHDAGGLHSGPQHVLLRGDVIRLGYPLQVVQVAAGRGKADVRGLHRSRAAPQRVLAARGVPSSG